MDMRTIVNRMTIVVLVLLAVCGASYGQELTQEQKKALQVRVKNKVDEYQFYLGQLADKRSTSAEVKTNAYNLAIKLFIGECENYEIYDPDLEHNVTKPAVRMEVSSKYRSSKSRTLMKRYLNNLRNNQTYDQIEITDADIVRVDNIYRVGDHYECVAYFCQKYIGYRDGRPVYSDVTTKKVRVYIQAIEIPRSDGSTETIWNALLGDIYVISTKPA